MVHRYWGNTIRREVYRATIRMESSFLEERSYTHLLFWLGITVWFLGLSWYQSH